MNWFKWLWRLRNNIYHQEAGDPGELMVEFQPESELEGNEIPD